MLIRPCNFNNSIRPIPRIRRTGRDKADAEKTGFGLYEIVATAVKHGGFTVCGGNYCLIDTGAVEVSHDIIRPVNRFSLFTECYITVNFQLSITNYQ